MSHVVAIEFRIRDLECLEKAAQSLGLEFHWGQTTHRWFNRFMNDYPLPEGFKPEELGHCEHAISVPNNISAYEIGVVPAKDGDGYVLLYDFWQGGYGLLDKIGQDANLLRQRYSVETVMKDRISQGYRVWEEVNPSTGRPRVVAER